MLASLVFFALGSAISGAAQSMGMLIAGRSKSHSSLSLSVCLICEVDRAGRICFKSCSRSRCRYVIPSLCYSQMLDLTQPCAMISRWRRNSLLD
jgi:hypothetical protein